MTTPLETKIQTILPLLNESLKRKYLASEAIALGKGGIRKLNQSPYMIHGFRLFDKVRINNQTGFIYGRRQSGSYLVKDIDGNIISSGISYKKLRLIEKRKGWIVDFKQS